jgi:hypothetical protein
MCHKVGLQDEYEGSGNLEPLPCQSAHQGAMPTWMVEIHGKLNNWVLE